jgi:hypothetical protein
VEHSVEQCVERSVEQLPNGKNNLLVGYTASVDNFLIASCYQEPISGPLRRHTSGLRKRGGVKLAVHLGPLRTVLRSPSH